MRKEQKKALAELAEAVEPFLRDTSTIGEDARQVRAILAPTPTKHFAGPAMLTQNTEDLLKRLAALPELAEQRKRLADAWRKVLHVFS